MSARDNMLTRNLQDRDPLPLSDYSARSDERLMETPPVMNIGSPISAIDIAYEEWAENFENPGENAENAFITGYRFGLHMAAKECAKHCEEETGAWGKKAGFKVLQRLKNLLSKVY